MWLTARRRRARGGRRGARGGRRGAELGQPAGVDGEFRAEEEAGGGIGGVGGGRKAAGCYSRGHRSRLVAPTGTKDSKVPVGATNRDQWPGRGGAWGCHVAPRSLVPVSSFNRDL